MNSLQHKDAAMIERVMAEYIDVLETVTPVMKSFYAYTPNVFDLVNAVPEQSWEEAMQIITTVLRENQVFIRCQEDYFFKPIMEVW